MFNKLNAVVPSQRLDPHQVGSRFLKQLVELVDVARRDGAHSSALVDALESQVVRLRTYDASRPWC